MYSVKAIVSSPRSPGAPTGPALIVSPPWIVRPTPTTPTPAVVRAAASAREAGADVVLAAQRGADWRLLEPLLTFPVVPVPLATGGTWHRLLPHPGPFQDLGPPRRPVLAVRVGRDAITITETARAPEAVPRAGDAGAALAAALRQRKASPAFADRADLQLAGDDDTTWADVVLAIDAAHAAGFVHWRLASPRALEVDAP